MRRALAEVSGVRAQGDTETAPPSYILLPEFFVRYGMMRVRRDGPALMGREDGAHGLAKLDIHRF